MTHTLRPSIRVCLILVKDIKLWWVPTLTSPLPSFVEDSAGFIRYVHPSDTQQEMTHKCRPKCWHQADTASSQNASHPFWQFLLLVIHNKRWHVCQQGGGERVPGEWEQSSGAVVQQRRGVERLGGCTVGSQQQKLVVAVTAHQLAAC